MLHVRATRTRCGRRVFNFLLPVDRPRQQTAFMSVSEIPYLIVPACRAFQNVSERLQRMAWTVKCCAEPLNGERVLSIEKRSNSFSMFGKVGMAWGL